MNLRQRAWIVIGLAFAGFVPLAHPDAVIELNTARLLIDDHGYARLEITGEEALWPMSVAPLVQLETDSETLVPVKVSMSGDQLSVQFPGGSSCELSVEKHDNFLVFELTQLNAPDNVERLGLLNLALPADTEVLSTLNGGRTARHFVSLSSAEINVHAYHQRHGRRESDREGCTHEFVQTAEARAGQGAAEFRATCNEQGSGWSYRGRDLPQPLDLSGCKAIRAWIFGDGKGEHLKIQLYDGAGGYRDTYIPIDFEGWKQVTISQSPLNTLREDRVTALNLYYNGLPASTTVSCRIDHIEAIVERDGQEESILLEDFEAATSPFWMDGLNLSTLNLETVARHGIRPVRFGLLVCPLDSWQDTMQRFEVAAGLPSPKPGGVWSKQSPRIERSYLFITRFSESQFDDVVAMARRGGFDTILILQSSWTRATGHYEINTDNFPGGLDMLVDTVQRFKDAGFHVGLHLLSASIDPPDAYLTPVPDPRLVKDASIELASDIDETTDFIPTATAPESFPAEDGGYTGAGTILQIGDELIKYGARVMEPPYGFAGCTRGHLGTKPARHTRDQAVQHLMRSYGYHLYDMDTALLDEVSSNFANQANACDIDMVYFDGSERLQGDHWYYNAKMHKAFYDKLTRKDILLQASSFSHYSWHILARSASADGHGDLKGYLDARSGVFDVFQNQGMPLDVGWYYGYDPETTPDMFEYVLGATIGYDSSMSFQVSVDAASKHPFINDILDLISRYERLRLSGRVPQAMRDRLRIDPALAGTMDPEERARLAELRREYRLAGGEGKEVFQRVVYAPWHTIDPGNEQSAAWQFDVPEGPATVGVQFHVPPGPWFAPGPAYYAEDALTLEAFDDLAPYLSAPGSRTGVHSLSQGEGGATLGGVTQSLTVEEGVAREGGKCVVYTAESTLDTDSGWTVITKQFSPALDLSWHQGIGLWLRGDGQGGLFKLQLRDDAGAVDLYITNDYTGWRYHQLPRPESDRIDYGQVRSLSFYYNQLPAKTTVSCAIDDVKALARLNRRVVTNPRVSVGEMEYVFPGTLSEGQYAVLWPGDAWLRYGPGLKEQPAGTAPEARILEKGNHAIKFVSEDPLTSLVRARVTLEPPERFAIP